MKKRVTPMPRHGIKRLLRIGFVTLVMSGFQHSAYAADLGKIMPMGDSITLGVPVAGGYRDPLYTLLTNRNDTFTFVGSETGYATTALTDAGQTHHEGHSGWVITNSIARTGLHENLVNWIGPGKETPDKILLMIGTNDIDTNNDVTNAPARLSALISAIYGYLPNVNVLLATIVPMNNVRLDNAKAFNAAIPGIVAEHRALGHHVTLVPMYDAVSISTDLSDTLHPNTQGYLHMAQAWDAALHTNSTLSLTLVAPANNATYSIAAALSATTTVAYGTAPYTVQFYLKSGTSDFIPHGASQTNSNTTFTADLSGLEEGTYQMYAVITDCAEPQASATSVTNTFTVSSYVDPMVPVLVSPVHNRAYSTAMMPAATMTVVHGTPPYTVQFYKKTGAGSFVAEGSPIISNSTTFSIPLDAWIAGTYQIYATLTDSATPQANATSTTNTFTVASSVHAIDLISAGAGAGLGQTYSVGWDFTVNHPIVITALGQFDPNGTTVSNTVAIYRRAGAKLVETAVLTSSPSEQSGIYSARYATIAPLVLTNGNYVIFSTQNGNNFVAPNGSPTAIIGSVLTWNKGVAMGANSAAGPLPVTAPATWTIENTDAYRYLGPTFKYDMLLPDVTVVSPTNTQSFSVYGPLFSTIAITNQTGTFTVHVYTNRGNSAFAEVGTGSSSSTTVLSLGRLPEGTYAIYASVTDQYSIVHSHTNTFTVVTPKQQPLQLTGWNKDLIIGATETAPGYNISMSGWNFYEYGLSGKTNGLPADSDTTNRLLYSTYKPATYNTNVIFQFQPYTNNNTLYLEGVTSNTLTLVTPAKFYALQFLITARNMNWYARLNFSDGTSTNTPTWSDPDWIANPGPGDRCLTSYGLKKTSDGSFYTGYLWMADRRFTLAPTHQTKTLTSITFVSLTTGSYQLAVFAVSGYVLDPTSNTIHALNLLTAGDSATGGDTYSVGWDFTVLDTITITALGQFDPNGIAKSNTVAIYQRGGVKLRQVSVLTNSPAEWSGNYSTRYEHVPALVLTNGNYVIISTQNGDNFIASGGAPMANLGPAIKWNKGIAMASGSSAGPLPTTAPEPWPINNTTPYRYFGPTFQYQLGILWPKGTIFHIR